MLRAGRDSCVAKNIAAHLLIGWNYWSYSFNRGDYLLSPLLFDHSYFSKNTNIVLISSQFWLVCMMVRITDHSNYLFNKGDYLLSPMLFDHS
jgi:hypothetical protein